MKKINVIGTSGSGKSTFGRQLAAILNVEFIELDSIFWGPNWTETPDDEYFAKITAALDGKEGWVLDGNYTRTIPVKWKDVDTVIWLDLPFWLNFSQSVKRSLQRVWSQEEMWGKKGNVEGWGKLFSSDSVVWWMMKTHGRNRRRNGKYFTAEEYAHINFIRLRSHKAFADFLENFEKA